MQYYKLHSPEVFNIESTKDNLLSHGSSQPCIDSKLNILFAYLWEKEAYMSKVKRIKCPDCLNYMTVTVNDNGEAKGCCKKCNAVIIAKQPSEKERLIRIVKAQ